MAEVEAGDAKAAMEIDDNVVDTNPSTHLKEVSTKRDNHLLFMYGLA